MVRVMIYFGTGELLVLLRSRSMDGRERHCQPGEWPPARLVHLRAAWCSRLLAAAALVGQAAARLAPADPSPALGSPHGLWAAGAAAGSTGDWIGHLVGRRWSVVFRGIQSVELAYWPGLRAHCGYGVSHVRTRQTAAQTRPCRKTTGAAIQCVACRQCGALARPAASRTCAECARCQAALHRLI